MYILPFKVNLVSLINEFLQHDLISHNNLLDALWWLSLHTLHQINPCLIRFLYTCSLRGFFDGLFDCDKMKGVNGDPAMGSFLSSHSGRCTGIVFFVCADYYDILGLYFLLFLLLVINVSALGTHSISIFMWISSSERESATTAL